MAKPVQSETPEKAALKKWNSYRKQHAPLPNVIIKQDGSSCSVSPDHDDYATGLALQMNATASAYHDYFSGMLNAIGNLSIRGGKSDPHQMDYMLAMVAGINPRDQLESMLALQMAAVHDAAMETAARIKRVRTGQEKESAERAFIRLSRTFTAQTEALKRYRSKGEQRVYVERVTVNEGGQAIVGLVERGGGDGKKSEG